MLTSPVGPPRMLATYYRLLRPDSTRRRPDDEPHRLHPANPSHRCRYRPHRQTVRVRGEAEACTDLSCSEQTLVVSDDGGTRADLSALNAGDIVKLEGPPGQPRRIVVVRRVWDELSSPEW